MKRFIAFLLLLVATVNSQESVPPVVDVPVVPPVVDAPVPVVDAPAPVVDAVENVTDSPVPAPVEVSHIPVAPTAPLIDINPRDDSFSAFDYLVSQNKNIFIFSDFTYFFYFNILHIL